MMQQLINDFTLSGNFAVANVALFYEVVLLFFGFSPEYNLYVMI